MGGTEWKMPGATRAQAQVNIVAGICRKKPANADAFRASNVPAAPGG